MAKKKAKNDTILNVDEVYTKTEQFVDHNRKQLTMGLGATAVVILAFMGYRTLVQQPAELAAEESIFQSEYYFAIDSLDLAQFGDGFSPGLEEVMEDHPGTAAAARAAFQVGVINRDAGLYDEAIEAFGKVDFDDEALGPLALAGIGDCYTELGDYSAAESYFKKAGAAADASLASKVISSSIHYKQALVLIELGRIDDAKGVLSHIQDKHPSSSYFKTAQALDASL